MPCIMVSRKPPMNIWRIAFPHRRSLVCLPLFLTQRNHRRKMYLPRPSQPNASAHSFGILEPPGRSPSRLFPALPAARRTRRGRPARAVHRARDAINRQPRPIMARNRSKAGSASCGPGAASGWYCREKAGTFRASRPSTVPSFRLTCVISATAASSVSGSTT